MKSVSRSGAAEGAAGRLRDRHLDRRGRGGRRARSARPDSPPRRHSRQSPRRRRRSRPARRGPSASARACACRRARPSSGRSRRRRSRASGESAKYMVRPSGQKQVELAQRTPPKSRVSFRSGSSRQTDEIGARSFSSMPPAMKRPCRSVRPSLSRVCGRSGSNAAMSSRSPARGSKKAKPSAKAATIVAVACAARSSRCDRARDSSADRASPGRRPRASCRGCRSTRARLVERVPEHALAVEIAAVEHQLGLHRTPPARCSIDGLPHHHIVSDIPVNGAASARTGGERDRVKPIERPESLTESVVKRLRAGDRLGRPRARPAAFRAPARRDAGGLQDAGARGAGAAAARRPGAHPSAARRLRLHARASRKWSRSASCARRSRRARCASRSSATRARFAEALARHRAAHAQGARARRREGLSRRGHALSPVLLRPLRQHADGAELRHVRRQDRGAPHASRAQAAAHRAFLPRARGDARRRRRAATARRRSPSSTSTSRAPRRPIRRA